jgi:hypothetical protein
VLIAVAAAFDLLALEDRNCLLGACDAVRVLTSAQHN